jgi:hypothetical protein
MGTASPLEVWLRVGNGLPLFTVIDDRGRLVTRATWFNGMDLFGGGAVTGARRIHVLVHDQQNLPGTIDFSVRPQLWFRNAATDRTLLVADEAGRQVHLFASLALLPAPVPLPAPLQGNLLIDLGLHVYVGAQTMPASGRLTWPLSFQPYPVALQGLSVAASPFDAAMTQAVR